MLSDEDLSLRESERGLNATACHATLTDIPSPCATPHFFCDNIDQHKVSITTVASNNTGITGVTRDSSDMLHGLHHECHNVDFTIPEERNPIDIPPVHASTIHSDYMPAPPQSIHGLMHKSVKDYLQAEGPSSNRVMVQIEVSCFFKLFNVM